MRKDLHWNMNNVTVNQMNEHLYRINEKDENGLNVDCYLVLGNQKAALIDTCASRSRRKGMSKTDCKASTSLYAERRSVITGSVCKW